jgi:protein-tyrosine phosphatase
MREACDLVAKKYGSDYARSLCVTNPMAAFEGREFEAEEEPRGLVEEVKIPNWWQRMAERLKRR